jgi:hypothetical protein
MPTVGVDGVRSTEEESVTSHDEPNEWGFAGDPTAPEPAHDTTAEHEEDLAEQVAVPADDLTAELSEALAEVTDGDEDVGQEPGTRGQ